MGPELVENTNVVSRVGSQTFVARPVNQNVCRVSQHDIHTESEYIFKNTDQALLVYSF